VRSSKARASVVVGAVGIAVNSVVLVASLVLVVPPVLHFLGDLRQAAIDESNPGGFDDEATSEPTQDEDVDEAEPTATAEEQPPSTGTVTLEESYSVATGNAYWGFPAPPDGWELVTFDENGLNQIATPDRMQSYRTMQGQQPLTSTTDLDATRETIELFMQGAGVTLTGEESRMTFAQMSDGRLVEFLVQHYVYTTPDGVAVNAVVAARSFDGGRYLIATYDAADPGFSEDTWQQLTGATLINDVG
jgi:hypothetical protein